MIYSTSARFVSHPSNPQLIGDSQEFSGAFADLVGAHVQLDRLDPALLDVGLATGVLELENDA